MFTSIVEVEVKIEVRYTISRESLDLRPYKIDFKEVREPIIRDRFADYKLFCQKLPYISRIMDIFVIFIFIIIIIIMIIIFFILYISFRSITMKNLEVISSKLTELWPFNDFSKIISHSLTESQVDLHYPLVADKKVKFLVENKF